MNQKVIKGYIHANIYIHSLAIHLHIPVLIQKYIFHKNTITNRLRTTLTNRVQCCMTILYDISSQLFVLPNEKKAYANSVYIK